MSNKYEYIAGDLRSEERLKELLDIQSEQLNEWEVLLKPQVFKLLKDFIDLENKKLDGYVKSGLRFNLLDHVARGTDLDNYLANLSTQPALWSTLLQDINA